LNDVVGSNCSLDLLGDLTELLGEAGEPMVTDHEITGEPMVTDHEITGEPMVTDHEMAVALDCGYDCEMLLWMPAE
jgi:hypothetical protein